MFSPFNFPSGRLVPSFPDFNYPRKDMMRGCASADRNIHQRLSLLDVEGIILFDDVVELEEEAWSTRPYSYVLLENSLEPGKFGRRVHLDHLFLIIRQLL
jgi:hypothetical protein